MRRSNLLLLMLCLGTPGSSLLLAEDGEGTSIVRPASLLEAGGLSSKLSVDPAALDTPPDFVAPKRSLGQPSAPGGQPLWLKNIIHGVLENHPEIRSYEAETRSVEFRKRAAEKQHLPSVRVMSQYGTNNKTLELQQGRSEQEMSPRNLQLSVSMPLYDASIAANVKRESTMIDAADWQAVSVKEQYILRAVEGVLELWKAHRLLELARENLQSHRRYVGQVKDIARVDIGKAADLATAQARVALAESVMANRLGRLELMRSQWQQTTRMHWSVVKEIMELGSLESLPLPAQESSLDQIIVNALANSAFVAKASSEVDAARSSVDVAKAQFNPTLYSEARMWRGSNLDGLQARQEGYYYGVNLDWKLPWSGMRGNTVDSALETVNAKLSTKEKIELELTGRIESEWYNRIAARAALRSYRAYESSAIRVVAANQAQFRIGRRSLLDMLNSEGELFTARSNLVTAEADQLIALWRLQSLQGKIAMEFGL